MVRLSDGVPVVVEMVVGDDRWRRGELGELWAPARADNVETVSQVVPTCRIGVKRDRKQDRR